MCNYQDILHTCGCDIRLLARECRTATRNPSSPCPRTRIISVRYGNSRCKDCREWEVVDFTPAVCIAPPVERGKGGDGRLDQGWWSMAWDIMKTLARSRHDRVWHGGAWDRSWVAVV